MLLVLVLVLVLVGGVGVPRVEVAVEPGHVVVVVVEPLGQAHVEVAGGDAVLHHTAHLQLKAFDAQAAERLAQAILVGPEVEKGGGQHVPGDAGRALQIEGLSHGVPFRGASTPALCDG